MSSDPTKVSPAAPREEKDVGEYAAPQEEEVVVIESATPKEEDVVVASAGPKEEKDVNASAALKAEEDVGDYIMIFPSDGTETSIGPDVTRVYMDLTQSGGWITKDKTIEIDSGSKRVGDQISVGMLTQFVAGRFVFVIKGEKGTLITRRGNIQILE